MVVQNMIRKTIVTIIPRVVYIHKSCLFRIWFQFKLPKYQEMNFVVISLLESRFNVGIMRIHVAQ